MKYLVMQFSPFSCYFLTLQSKYSAQHPVPSTDPRKARRRSLDEMHMGSLDGRTKIFSQIPLFPLQTGMYQHIPHQQNE